MGAVNTKVINFYKEKAKQGLSIDNAIIQLHEDKFTIIESMKILVYAYNIALNEAKQHTTSHSVWQDVTDAAKPLHNDLIDFSNQSTNAKKNKKDTQ